MLAIDIGGTGLKAALLNVDGKMTSERQRIDTPYPCSPERMIDALLELCGPLGDFDFLSIGFPGVVRDGKVLTAPHFDHVDPDDPFAAGIMQHANKAKKHDKDSAEDAGSARKAADTTDKHGVPTEDTAWRGFALGQAVAAALAKQTNAPVRPVQVINDAEMQGLAVIRGEGLEFVLTLGTGAGSALFRDGVLMPHLELAHHPIRGRKSYNDYVGDAARKKIGKKRWNRHVQRTLAILDSLLHFDHLYIGGGNAQRIAFPLPQEVTIVSNDAGIEGGAALWRDVAV
ncbi:ROK family protein [Robbsia sp. KACC 23696]|uniref:ROK family protein n=1 Tax=Robbsia sp. KACC 23696 TaxID=3149231 RepID=UPI00325BAF15